MSNKIGARRKEAIAAQSPAYLPMTHREYVSCVRPHIIQDVERMAKKCAEANIDARFCNLDEVPFYDRKASMMRELENQADRMGKKLRKMDMDRQDYINGLRAQPETLRMLLHMVEYDTVLLLRHQLSGAPVFRISAALAQRLAETRMNVPVERMKLPYPTMLLVFDDEITSTALSKMSEGRKASIRSINVMVSELENEDGRRWNFITNRFNATNNEVQLSRSLALDVGGDAEEALQTNWEQRNGATDEHAEKISGKPVKDSLHYEEGLDYYRIVVNALLYITSYSPSVTNHQRVGQAVKGQKRPVKYVVAGEEMVPFSKDQALNDNDGDGSPTGRGPVRLHMVRGHWKNQVTGKNGSIRKHIFVEPYLRGADADTLVSMPRYVS